MNRAEHEAISQRLTARTKILHDVRLSFGARVLYFEIDDRAATGGVAWAKQHKLAMVLGIEPRMLQRYQRELQDLAHVRVERDRYFNRFFPAWSDTTQVSDLEIQIRQNQHSDTTRVSQLASVSLYEPVLDNLECLSCQDTFWTGEGFDRVPCLNCRNGRMLRENLMKTRKQA